MKVRRRHPRAIIRPMLVRENGQLTVPERSPLRSRLVVATVAATTGADAIPVPTVVEAEPARTVNILPPSKMKYNSGCTAG